MCDQQSLRPACAYAQSDQSLCSSLEYSMNIKLLTEHHFEVLTLKGGCTGLSESIHVKIPHCWKSHVAAQMVSFVHQLCLYDQSFRNIPCDILICDTLVNYKSLLLKKISYKLLEVVFWKKTFVSNLFQSH